MSSETTDTTTEAPTAPTTDNGQTSSTPSEVATSPADGPAPSTGNAPASSPPSDGSADTVDTSEQIAALEAQLAELKADRDARAKAEADAAERAKTTAGKLEVLAEQLEAERAARRAERRDAMLDALRVKPIFRADAPKVDVTTDEGAKALAEWVEARPEVQTRAAVVERPPTAHESIIKRMEGKASNGLVTPESVRSGFVGSKLL